MVRSRPLIPAKAGIQLCSGSPLSRGRAECVRLDLNERSPKWRRGVREKGSMGAHQLLAGALAGLAMRALYGVRYTDMGPLRAIRREALERLGMRERTYGWNLEMQMRAARTNLRILEVPVAHRNRAGGASKVAGSLRGTLRASWNIAATFVRIARAR